MWRGIVTAVASVSIVACGVDDRCDLSKDIDLTISVGKDLAFSIGSTEKILLSDLIKTSDGDVLKVDEESGDYSIVKEGSFSPVEISVGELRFKVDAASEKKHYDFELINLSDVANLPSWIVDEMKKQKYPFVTQENIEYKTIFDVTPVIPKEVKKLRRLSLADKVKFEIELKIYSENHNSDDVLELTKNIHLKSNDEDGLVINLPEYLVFTEKSNVNGGKLVLEGAAEYDADKKALIYKKELYIEAVDFSNSPEGYRLVKDGIIEVHDTLSASGRIVSDTIMLGYDNVTHIQSVDVECAINIGPFVVKEVEGVFDPEIEPIKESVSLNLGTELDFIKNAYFDFSDPKIYLTLNNPVGAEISAEAEFVAIDEAGLPVEDSEVNVGLNFLGNSLNKFFINRHNATTEGYTTVCVPNLNNIMKRIPEKVDVLLNAKVKDDFSTIALNSDYKIFGDYTVAIPMVFDSLRLVYTEHVDNLMSGSNKEGGEQLSDYLDKVGSVTLSFDLLNTIPFELTPDIKAYDKDGNPLNSVALDVDGIIKRGNGVVDGVVTEPVASHIVAKISAAKLDKLDRIDINITGAGAGSFNAKEYIQMKNIVISIDEPISVDLNEKNK